MKKVYIAGKLWDDNDRKKLEVIDDLCKNFGLKTFLPHRDAGLYKEGLDSKTFFEKDRDMVDWCDFMVAILDWKGIGSGTAWEIGYAHARKIPVIALVEDINSLGKFDRVCVMCLNSVKLVENFKDLEKEIKMLK